MKNFLNRALAVCFFLSIPSLAAADDVVHERDHFQFTYRLTLPKLTGPAQWWLPLAQTDAFQTVQIDHLAAPLSYREIIDQSEKNKLLYLTPGAAESGRKIEIVYTVERREKAAYPDSADPALFLQPDRLVPNDARFRDLGREVIGPRTDRRAQARALYRHVLGRIKYEKTGQGWGRGDATYACDTRTGNCTDFHSYFMALARAAGIPARFAIGFSIPADKDEGAIAGYHCWAEFFAAGRWIPLDISEAWKNPKLAEYYFGHHPANRFELTRGRDLLVRPAPAGGPINFLVYPLLEVDGQPVKVETEFRFRRLP